MPSQTIGPDEIIPTPSPTGPLRNGLRTANIVLQEVGKERPLKEKKKKKRKKDYE